MSAPDPLIGAFGRLSQVAIASAEYNSPERHPHPKCLSGTRVKLLDHSYERLDNTEASRLVWLNGTAGVGKSAVAYTVAERMRDLKLKEDKLDEKRLGGTFFFSRSKPDSSTAARFFPTLAYQLAINFPSLRTDYLDKAIEDNPALLNPNKSLREQMEWLLLRPLQRLQLRLPRTKYPPLVFVIDALDECTSEPQITELVSLLCEVLRDPDIPVTHILLTSRSDTHASNAIRDDRLKSLVHEIPIRTSGEDHTLQISLEGADADDDICLFLKHSFKEKQRGRSNFPQPTEDELKQLVNRAGGRFIVASTMMNFIDDEHNDPCDRLQLMLELTCDLLPGTEVYTLYEQILDTCTNPSRAYLHLSVVAALVNPLPLSQILELLGRGQNTHVESDLVQLRSIIDIPADSSLPVNLHHSTVREYVLDLKTRKHFGGQKETISSPHALLALYSFRLMIPVIKNSTSLRDALSRLKAQSQAMKSHPPKNLKNSLAFAVEPPTPVGVLTALVWLRKDRPSTLYSWLERPDGRSWLRTKEGSEWLLTSGLDWLKTRDGLTWMQTKDAGSWLGSRGGTWVLTGMGDSWLLSATGQDWLKTDRGREWLKSWCGYVWKGKVKRQEWLEDKHAHPCPQTKGREWLQTDDGRKWLETNSGREWLETNSGWEWLRTNGGREWLGADSGLEWLVNTSGQEWLGTDSGQEWLENESGRKWLETYIGRNWLESTSGVEWLQTDSGMEWLQTDSGRRWLQTDGQDDWLQTDIVQEWLQTPSGQQWLQADSGRDWLKTLSGREWLHTDDGRKWLQANIGQQWLQEDNGKQWLHTDGGKQWLQTESGREWLQTDSGRQWEQNCRERERLEAARAQGFPQTDGEPGSRQTGSDLQTFNLQGTEQEWPQIGRTQLWLYANMMREWMQTYDRREWLQTDIGKMWLQTGTGRDWLQTNNGREWLNTHREWLQTNNGQEWLQTPGGFEWLQTNSGLEWLQTDGRLDWLDSRRGREWLRTNSGEGWLQTNGGEKWLEADSGKSWLETHSARDWLQNPSARRWLQTDSGRHWLDTPNGREWLQTNSGREWLQSPGGKEWLQTAEGKTWKLSPAASFWVQMQEFLDTVDAISDFNNNVQLSSSSTCEIIKQFESLPDFLMFPTFLALAPDRPTSETLPHYPKTIDFMPAMGAFVVFADEARKQNQSVSGAFVYACQNWAIHLSQNPDQWDDKLSYIFRRFRDDYLASWLETQWRLRGLRSCLDVLSKAQKFINQEDLIATTS